MVKISINGNSHEVPQGITIIQACEIAGIEIPRFVITKDWQLRVIVACV